MDLVTTFPRWPTQGLFTLARRRQAPSTSPRVAEQRRRLPRHATLRLPDHASEIRVVSGCVWITRDGCAADWVLEAGQVFRQQQGSRVLVHALADAEFVLARDGTANQNE